MYLTDIALNKLKTYRGSSPIPADFDAFWDEGVREMKALDADVQLIPSPFQVPGVQCCDLYFTGVGGARVHAKLARPAAPKGKVPAVLIFHGYTLDSGDWMEKVSFAACGVVAAALDCRGQGGLSEDSGRVKGNTLHGHIIRGLDEEDPRKLYYRQVFLDAAQLAQIVMDLPDVDETRVGAYGGSQGGALAMVCAALEPRLNRTAPMFPFLSDYRFVCGMEAIPEPYEELQEYFRSFDPRHEREDEIFTKLGYIDIQNLAPRIKAEVRMYTALLDDKAAGVPAGVIARRFHDAFVQVMLDAAQLCRALYGIQIVALSGGVFMNRYLAEHVLAALEAEGFTVAVNRDLPPNDGCVSYGQAVVACAARNEDA